MFFLKYALIIIYLSSLLDILVEHKNTQINAYTKYAV